MTPTPHKGTPGSAYDIPDPLPLVGRTEELARLEALLERPDDETSLVFVRADGGLGKSRLVAELARRAERRAWKVARGQAYPVETGVPYALFADAWLPILREMDASTLAVLSRGGEAELRYLFPALGTTSGASDGFGDDPEEFRTRLMWNFAEFLKRLAARGPILCVLEDLHWADESSLQLIHFLARQTSGHSVLLICTYNEQERERSPQLIRAEQSLLSVNVATVLKLGPLSLDQVSELVVRTFGVDSDAVRSFAAVLYGWTRGNPFFVEEIVKSLVATGRIRSEGGTWVGWDAKDFGMPGSIRDAVVQRIRGFSESAGHVVELAAIVGARATYALLESICGLPSQTLLQALEELCANRVLEERSEGDEVVFLFAHPLVREILYAEFGLARARVLHGVVAEAMERHFGAGAVDHADELAFHFSRTGAGEMRAKATRYLVEAGRRALERRADREAVDYLEQALARTRQLPTGDDAVRELAPLLARAYTHRGRFADAAKLLSASLEHLDANGPEHLSVRRLLGMTYFWCGDHAGAHGQFDAGLETARTSGDDAAVVRLLVAKAHCLHEVGRGRDAVDTLGPALPLASALEDARLLARVHRALALLHVWVGPPERAEEHGQRAIELAEEVGDLAIEFWARWGLAVLAGMRGNTARMADTIAQINALADKSRSPVLRLWTADLAVELAYARGDWDRGIVEGEQAIALARSLNQRTLLPRILVWTSQFYVARAEFERAAELIAEAEAVSGLNGGSGPRDVHRVVPTYIGKAHYLVGLGDFDAAIAAAEKGLEIAEGTGYVLWAMHWCLPILAEACFWANYVERAQAVGERMRAHAETIDHRLGLAWADACESLVRWKRGDPEGSIPLMRAAADALDAIPMVWYATRLRRQLAARLWEAGRADEAKDELDRVWEMCVRLRAGIEKEKTRTDYKKMGLKAPVEHRADGPLGLTPEELEIAKLVAVGMSNPEIASKRKSKVRTVSTHLSNIYKKLEVGGAGARFKLGKMIREAGLAE